MLHLFLFIYVITWLAVNFIIFWSVTGAFVNLRKSHLGNRKLQTTKSYEILWKFFRISGLTYSNYRKQKLKVCNCFCCQFYCCWLTHVKNSASTSQYSTLCVLVSALLEKCFSNMARSVNTFSFVLQYINGCKCTPHASLSAQRGYKKGKYRILCSVFTARFPLLVIYKWQ